MLRLIPRRRASPIGIDIGSRWVKIVQFTESQSGLIDAAQGEVPGQAQEADSAERARNVVSAIQGALNGHSFVGRDVVLGLNERQLFLQSVRVAKGDQAAIDRLVQQEAVGRIPFPIAEAEIRYVEAADIRQGEQILREIILMACHRPVLDQLLALVEQAGLNPVSVDVEPAAVLRAYGAQLRRDEDRRLRSLIAHVGYASTLVLIAHGTELLFVKYVELGGKQFDEAVARTLKMELPSAAALRRYSGDRRVERQDPDVARSISEATRPIVDRLANELAMCVRYHSVTFRGQPLERLVVGGGEAIPSLMESLNHRLGLKCELSDPFRAVTASPIPAAARGRATQWDVACGLALRPLGGGQA